MLQVSADVHVPLAPADAESVARDIGQPDVRVPPHVREGRVGWRFEPEDDGTLVVLTYAYVVTPDWVQRLTTEVTRWWLRRDLQSHLASLQDAAAASNRG